MKNKKEEEEETSLGQVHQKMHLVQGGRVDGQMKARKCSMFCMRGKNR